MAKNCNLCGGRVVNGICTECGMDNSKSDNRYLKQLNQADCDKKPLTHVHPYEEQTANTWKSREKAEEKTEKKEALKLQPKYQKKEDFGKAENFGRSGDFRKEDWKKYAGNASSHSGSSKSYSKNSKSSAANKKSRLAFFITVGAALLSMGTAIVPFFELGHRTPVPEVWEITNAESWEEIAPVYPETYPDIAGAGDSFDTELTAGVYKVGVQIPEGYYNIDIDKQTALQINNAELPYHDFLSGGNGAYIVEGEPLYAGSWLTVSDGGKVHLKTENGQISAMEPMQKNLLEEVKEVSGELVSGVDFEPGVYDLSVVNDEFGKFEVYLLGETDMLSQFCLSMKGRTNIGEIDLGSYATEAKNIPLPKGCIIKTGSMVIRMEPSEEIVTDDLREYYEDLDLY